tara:strand:- start:69 stop:1385 length:1317 start_codon:yes stop_codon:yes gene_type:complete
MTKETNLDVAGSGISKKRVLVVGPILTQTGYGEHARFMWRALKSRPDLFDVFVSAINWGNSGWLWEDSEERKQIDDDIGKTQYWIQQGGTFDTTLMVTIPQEWPNYRAATNNIGVTAGVETSKISELWVQSTEAVDKILLTSNFSKEVFEKASYVTQHPQTGEKTISKVNVPMEVVNYPVKEYEKTDLNLNLTTDFNFLTVAQWGARKNIENTVQWFVEEFIDQEVGLVLKLQMLNGGQRDKVFTRESLEKILKQYPDRKCKVYLLHGYISDAEMHSLYTHPKIKALISLSHGEGFGLPLFEAAYSGLPVLTHDWGGQTDFLMMDKKGKKGKVSKRPFYANVDYDLSTIQPAVVWENILLKDSQWAYPKQGSYKMKLRDIYKNLNRYQSQAKKLKKFLVEEFSKEKQYERVVDSICDKEYMEMTQWFEELSEEIVEVA